ncbi:hypothetical protein MPH_12379 [Macrophomina phaseolina MS6]|uniref:Uncharacterized protein n=1 Tax=Macrophomina phaseolina (strain MS6) TaxID=1126212 RepID=K2QL41_MACPH|nr:hypothetical protein MPH_12379 [Macrophomina phaseolina MS6]
MRQAILGECRRGSMLLRRGDRVIGILVQLRGRRTLRYGSGSRASNIVFAARLFILLFLVLILVILVLVLALLALPVIQVAMKDLLHAIQLTQIDCPHLIKRKLPIRLLKRTAVHIQHIILHRQRCIKPRMRHLKRDRLLRPLRPIVLFLPRALHLTRHLLALRPRQRPPHLQRLQVPQQLLLIRLPAASPPATTTTPLRAPLFLPARRPRLAQREREVAVAVDIPGEELVEELRVDALLALLDIVHAAEQDSAALVVGHGRARARRVGRIGGLLAALPVDFWQRGGGVGSGRDDAQKPGVLVHDGLEHVAGGGGPGFAIPAAFGELLDARIAAVEHGAGVGGQEGEGGARVGLLGGGRHLGLVPLEGGGVVNPDVVEVFCLLAGVLEAAEEDDVVLEVGHAVAAAGGRALTFAFEACPFAGGGLEAPEVVIMVERALLRAGKLAAEEVDGLVIAAACPGVTGARERGVGGGDLAPLVSVDVVDEEVVEEVGEGAVKVLATEEEELVVVGGRADEGRGAARRWRLRNGLGDLEELFLLTGIFCQHGV